MSGTVHFLPSNTESLRDLSFLTVVGTQTPSLLSNANGGEIACIQGLSKVACYNAQLA
ncbi:hypothetical protein SNOG_14033 [Parastagonospora nodorum SN15]|uniref:Uncharacterized protein n=1 Tax=Phaeosphaeria nodorum (strain SN15 / ATCC MYA-4574 / FGSC 10173) TaxID=321614 RepID=Q0U2K0_PHANO|nr:hypothetical protein SNOG_14033 [Parastagonospora nodorum SN15]EAT78658.1 hypothetical protein SNOG_14033 [Parastagonospora nodorum SN15]